MTKYPFKLGAQCEGPGHCKMCDQLIKSAQQSFNGALDEAKKGNAYGKQVLCVSLIQALTELAKRRHMIPNS